MNSPYYQIALTFSDGHSFSTTFPYFQEALRFALHHVAHTKCDTTLFFVEDSGYSIILEYVNGDDDLFLTDQWGVDVAEDVIRILIENFQNDVDKHLIPWYN